MFQFMLKSKIKNKLEISEKILQKITDTLAEDSDDIDHVALYEAQDYQRGYSNAIKDILNLF